MATKKAKATKNSNVIKYKEAELAYEPVSVAMAGDADYPTTRSRRNVIAITEKSYRFKNIEDGLTPFTHNNNYDGFSSVSVRDAVILCQKAYYNFGIIRNVTELHVDFSATDIYLRGSTSKIRKFYEAWFKKIGLNSLKTMYFREMYRSSNVFLYEFPGKIKESDLTEISNLYGGKGLKSKSVTIPIRYVILNPADIQVGEASAMNIPVYYKMLSGYELECLRNPRTKEDQEVVDNLPEDVRKQIKNKVSSILLPLDIKKINAIFGCKQSYEPLAVPPFWSVMESLNTKAEFMKCDAAMVRICQQCILLITMGAKPEDGGVNPANILAMQKLFQNETIGRCVISDYTTKGEFILPDLKSILDPSKYEVLDREINNSINNILVGDDKFSSGKNKIDVFISRLEQGRNVFLESFLIPAMAKVGEAMGFSSIPTPCFEEIALKDDVQKDRLFARMAELGILTPSQTLEAINTGRTPDKNELEESQKEYLKQRDEGFYEPLIGGSNRNSENGRPAGSGTPKMSNTPSQIGVKTTGSETITPKYSMKRIVENFILAEKLEKEIEKTLKTTFKAEQLSSSEMDILEKIRDIVIANESPENWISKAAIYCDEPIDKNKERVNKVLDISIKSGVESYLAGILLASLK